MAGELERRSTDLVRQVGDTSVLIRPAADIERAGIEEDFTSPEVYLGTDIFIGEYGAASFSMVVPRPTARPFVYPEGPSGPWNENEFKLYYPDRYEDPVRRAHYLGTDQGFVVVRMLIAVPEVGLALDQDRFFGPALVDKAFFEDTLPRGFDEEHGLSLHDSLGYENFERFEAALDRVKSEAGMSEHETHRAFPSWHSWRMYQPVIADLSVAAQRTVAKFDAMMSLLQKPPRRQIRDLPPQVLDQPSKPRLEP